MILNCLVIDDEPIARKLLQEYIEETDFLKLVGTAENPVKATSLLNDLQIDLIFLDINMPKMNGMAFLRSANNLPMVIMTTAYGQYALEGFEMDVIDYLVKPFSLERFLKATQKALQLHTLKQKKQEDKITIEDDHFFAKCDGRLQRILIDDIIYVEGMSNYIVVYTNPAKYVIYLTIKGLLEKLPSEKFIQVHKGYIVNVKRINTIDGNTLHIGDARISVGASFRETVMNKLLSNRFFKR